MVRYHQASEVKSLRKVCDFRIFAIMHVHLPIVPTLKKVFTVQ